MPVEPEFARRVAEAAFGAAVLFFQPSAEWDVSLKEMVIDQPETPAQCWTKPQYFLAQIVYDPAQCDNGEEVWRVIGHEVAHLLSSEFNVIEMQQPARMQGFFVDASERLTTRLTRLWVRERRYPGDDRFKEADT